MKNPIEVTVDDWHQASHAILINIGGAPLAAGVQNAVRPFKLAFFLVIFYKLLIRRFISKKYHTKYY